MLNFNDEFSGMIMFEFYTKNDLNKINIKELEELKNNIFDVKCKLDNYYNDIK